MIYNKILYIIAISAILVSGCRKTFLPSTAIDEESALTNAGDIETATIGTYALFKNPGYVRSNHFLIQYPTDEVAQGQNSSDDLTRCYRYTHLAIGTHGANFWSQAYLSISAANRVIGVIPDDAPADMRQLKGENLFIRAMLHFNLVRVFGRPYPQGAATNPGVPILKEGLSEEERLKIPRNTVKEVYEAVVADLLKSEQLMSYPKSNAFASKEVAQALLARVYLYMEENIKAIEYANKVINSGRYILLPGGELPNYFRMAPEANRETILCIRHIKTEDRGFSSIGSMYFSGDANGNPQNQAVSGWGEIYASKKYVDFLNTNPGDRRKSFFSPLTDAATGQVRLNPRLTPATPMYYVNKYNMQEGIVNLSSPVYLRLAELYLIRAEANAKLGNTNEALADVNLIRTRAGIPAYTITDLTTSGKSIMDVVLEERWLELAFEGHRAYDLFRNGRAMVRNYPGSHVLGGSINQTIPPGDNRVIFFIPQSQIDANPSLTQNP